MKEDLFVYVLGLGDDALVLGHRLSEWCSHAPTLEEDLALANMALDHLGQAQLLLQYAGELDPLKRSADDLVFFRSSEDFRNVQLAELAFSRDFAGTIVRQVFFGEFQLLFLEGLTGAKDNFLAGYAAKALKEISYHVRHVGAWLERLGQGTEESNRRTASAVTEILPFTAELFVETPETARARLEFDFPVRESLRDLWNGIIEARLTKAGLPYREAPALLNAAGRSGAHTAALSEMLLEMQSVARLCPEARW